MPKSKIQGKRNQNIDNKQNKGNTRLLASHYGKWYLDPKDFNQSMNEHKKKLQKNAIIKQELEAEAAAHEKGMACFQRRDSSPYL